MPTHIIYFRIEKNKLELPPFGLNPAAAPDWTPLYLLYRPAKFQAFEREVNGHPWRM